MKKIFTKAGKESQKGLSLVEVLITIAVIAIVAAISLPIITTSIQRAQIDAHKAEMLLTADTIKSSIAGMGGVKPDANGTNFNLGGGTVDSYIRINANSDTRFRFDRNNENAFYTVTPSRVTRIVSDGDGSVDDPYTGFCITAWVGDVNLELNSDSSQVTEYTKDATYATGNGPCGLKPGPIAVPTAPTLAPAGIDAPVAVINDTIASISFVFPSGVDVGGEEWTGLTIVEGRVTCESNDGGTTRIATGATSPIRVTGLTPETNYSCTVAARNDGFLASDPNAWSDESEATDSFYMPNPPLAVVPTPLGNPGPEVFVSWTLATDPYGYDVSSPVYGGRMNINNYAIHYFERECKGVPPATGNEIAATATEIRTGDTDLNYTIQGLSAGKKYDIWVRALNGAGPDPAGGSGTNYIGFGDSVYVGCAETGKEPGTMFQGTNAEQNGLIGTNDLNGMIRLSWFVGNATGTGTASEYDTGGLPITSYTFEWDRADTFDSGDTGGPDGAATKTHTGAQFDQQYVDVSGIPVSTTYFFRIKACNQLNGPAPAAPVCALAWSGTVSGASSATAPPPESVEATVNNDGTAVVSWN